MGLPLLIAGRMVGRMWTDPAGKMAGYILIGEDLTIVSYEHCRVEIVRDDDGLQKAQSIVDERIRKNEEDLAYLDKKKKNIQAMRKEIRSLNTIHVGTMNDIINCEDGEYVNHEKNTFDRIIPDPSKYGQAEYLLHKDYGLCLKVYSTKASSGRRVLWRDCDEEGIYVLGSNKKIPDHYGYHYPVKTSKDLPQVRSWLKRESKNLRESITRIKEDLKRDLQMKWEVDQGLYREIKS